MRRAWVLATLLLACGRGVSSGPLAPARTAEELLAPWVVVTLGEGVDALRARRPGLEPGYASGTKAEYIDVHDPKIIVTVEAEDGRVREIGLQWRDQAADEAERALRARLPAPRECATLHESVEDFKSLLWRLPDGAGAMAMRKGKSWRLTVARPPADGFEALYESCARQ